MLLEKTEVLIVIWFKVLEHFSATLKANLTSSYEGHGETGYGYN